MLKMLIQSILSGTKNLKKTMEFHQKQDQLQHSSGKFDKLRESSSLVESEGKIASIPYNYFVRLGLYKVIEIAPISSSLSSETLTSDQSPENNCLSLLIICLCINRTNSAI